LLQTLPSNCNAIGFSVLAANNAHVALSSQITDAGAKIEIVLGGWCNKYSVVGLYSFGWQTS
jgi:hypothetical protein